MDIAIRQIATKPSIVPIAEANTMSANDMLLRAFMRPLDNSEPRIHAEIPDLSHLQTIVH